MPPTDPTLNIPTATGMRGYRYEAQGPDGRRISGAIDAGSPEWVSQQLALLQLRLIRLDPIVPGGAEPPPAAGGSSPALPRGMPLRGDDFLAFHQQLAQLAKAGLPIESGLRLIAKDMRSGKLAQTIQQVADELDRGTPIEQAFEKYRDRFPSFYGRLLGAGVRSGDLAGVLLGFSSELELQQRLRASLWRALSYPLTVMAGLTVVLLLLSLFVLPRFRDLYEGFSLGQTMVYDHNFGYYSAPIVAPQLPWPTQVLFGIGRIMPYLAAVLLAAAVAAPLVWQALRRNGRDRQVIDGFVLRLPFVGRPLRLSLIAGWCNALRIGASAGLPLPDAIALAGDAVRSPRLQADGNLLTSCLQRGLPLAPAPDLSILPATVPVALELASGHNDLPATLQSLSDLYERQAEARIQALPTVLTPILVIVVACSVGFVMSALILPFVRLLEFLR